jgi:hypothetical protein
VISLHINNNSSNRAGTKILFPICGGFDNTELHKIYTIKIEVSIGDTDLPG